MQLLVLLALQSTNLVIRQGSTPNVVGEVRRKKQEFLSLEIILFNLHPHFIIVCCRGSNWMIHLFQQKLSLIEFQLQVLSSFDDEETELRGMVEAISQKLKTFLWKSISSWVLSLLRVF